MKLQGRILLFDEVNLNNDIFSKACNLIIPEKVPLLLDFKHPIGVAEVSKDELGLLVTAETFSNEEIGIENLSVVFENGKIGAGGYYNCVKIHKDRNFTIIDAAKLWGVALVLTPVSDKYYLEIVAEKWENRNEGKKK